MDVVACVKLIPRADVPMSLDTTTGRLDRRGEAELDDSDAYGVEMGLRLVEQSGGGAVSVLSVAPEHAAAGLRTALAMGAAQGVLVSDETLAGSDALGTAKVLAAAIRRMSPDLVIAATESTDGSTGTVPVQVAELLGLPAVTFARHVEVKDGALIIERQTEEGFDEISCPMPAIVTVTAGAVDVRYPSIRGVMAARSRPIEVWSVGDLGIDRATIGAAGAHQRVVDVAAAPSRQAGRVVLDEGAAEREIVDLLTSLKLL